MAKPSFSIVIPTYQRRDMVCDTVRALTRIQYEGALELIVVIDGSSDGTAEALAQINCPFPVKLIAQANGGIAHARNRGAEQASGEILLFLDDDMIAQPDLIEQHVRSYGEGADAVLGHIPLDEGSPPGFLADDVAIYADSMLADFAGQPLDVFGGQLSVRRSVFEEIGGFDEEFTAGACAGNEDADFGVKLIAKYRLHHNPAAVTRQRYVVSLSENMRRVRRHAAADVLFAAKHPVLAPQLFESRGAFRRRTRFLYRPLGRIPLLPELLSEIAIGAAELAARTGFGSNRMIAQLFRAARSVLYWSAVRAYGGVPRRR